MIPTSILARLNEHEEAISFGSVTLKVVKHDGHKTRYLWTVETSEIEDSPTSGGGGHCNKRSYDTISQAEGK